MTFKNCTKKYLSIAYDKITYNIFKCHNLKESDFYLNKKRPYLKSIKKIKSLKTTNCINEKKQRKYSTLELKPLLKSKSCSSSQIVLLYFWINWIWKAALVSHYSLFVDIKKLLLFPNSIILYFWIDWIWKAALLLHYSLFLCKAFLCLNCVSP